MRALDRRGGLLTASVLAACFVAATVTIAQEKKEEEPFWAKGKPKEGVGAKMAPVAAPPVPTPEAQLPKLKAPAGFKVEVYQSGILDARGLRRGDKGTIFVSSLFVGSKIYAVTGEKGKRVTKTIASGIELPNGIEFKGGSLYVATPKQITRYDKIEDNLDKPPEPVKVFDQLPGDIPHGWKFIKFGPDGKLYVPVGAPCNICEPDPEKYAQIFRINADGSGKEIVARGVRNTVGFDFHPKTKELWFTDNQRDWLSEDMPLDELNRVANPGKDHFGYPYCHSGMMADPEFGWGKSCNDYVKPAALLGPHAAPLGMRFYTGNVVPGEVSQCDLHRSPRAMEPHHQVCRRVGRLRRCQQQGDERRAVPDGLRQGQPVPRPPGRFAGAAGWVAAGLGRSCGRHLSRLAWRLGRRS